MAPVALVVDVGASDRDEEHPDDDDEDEADEDGHAASASGSASASSSASATVPTAASLMTVLPEEEADSGNGGGRETILTLQRKIDTGIVGRFAALAKAPSVTRDVLVTGTWWVRDEGANNSRKASMANLFNVS